MATGHTNAGYRDPAARFRWTRPPTLVAGTSGQGGPAGGLNDPSMELIRQQARSAWVAPKHNKTSYQDHYRERLTLMNESTQGRPTSPHRHNKPHPPLVFLTCALHNVPGYHNANDVEPERDRVDGLLPVHEQQQKVKFGRKYETRRPCTRALAQYASKEGEPPFGADAESIEMPDIWQPKMATPFSPYREHTRMDTAFRRLEEDPTYNYEPKVLASHHRYLRPAGYEESMYLMGGGRALGSMHATERVMAHQSHGWKPGQTGRGEFLMHPEWGPQFTHHRLNGLSTPARAHSVTPIW